MPQFAVLPVVDRPFPHVLVDHYLDAGLYSELADGFPECPPNSGPTGYSCFWGDPEYEQLLAQSPPWRVLFDRVQSQAFVDNVLDQFRQIFTGEGTVDLGGARYVAYQDSRFDKEHARLSRIELAPDQLFVRMDIMQGRMGYDRAPHLDHRRRAATMLIYFCDGDECGMAGGDLILHGPGESAEPLVIRPKHNRMVLFPCNNASRHSVSAVTAQRAPRNFVQITVSSSVDLWAPVPVTLADRALIRLWMKPPRRAAG
jgi:hypothetical protein